MLITLLPNQSQHDDVSFILHHPESPLHNALVSVHTLLVRNIVREDDMYYFDLSLYGLDVTTNFSTETNIVDATVMSRIATHVRLTWSQPDEPITQDKLRYKRLTRDTNAIFDAVAHLVTDLFNGTPVEVIEPNQTTTHVTALSTIDSNVSNVHVKKGDMLDSDSDIIVQQVNTLGKMGAGLAKAIRNRYPFVYDEYMAFCATNAGTTMLGRILWTKQGDSPIVANIFGQASIRSGYRDTKCHTNYLAVSLGIDKVISEAKRTNRSVSFPHGFGSGLAGGDFHTIMLMLHDSATRHAQPVTVYQLDA